MPVREVEDLPDLERQGRVEEQGAAGAHGVRGHPIHEQRQVVQPRGPGQVHADDGPPGRVHRSADDDPVARGVGRDLARGVLALVGQLGHARHLPLSVAQHGLVELLVDGQAVPELALMPDDDARGDHASSKLRSSKPST